MLRILTRSVSEGYTPGPSLTLRVSMTFFVAGVIGLEFPAGVAGLPVVLAPGACEQVELLPGRRDGLGDLARVEALVDCAVELLDTLRQVGVRSGRGRGRRVLTVKPGQVPSTEGRPG